MLDLSQRGELSLHSEVAAAVVHVLTQSGMAGIVVGAFARDLHLHYGAGVPQQRRTEDVDFAFAIDTWAAFDALKRRVIESGAFRAVEGNQHRLVHANGIKIDLVPFGSIERSDRTIAWPPTGDTIMDVYGFQESLASSEQVLLPGNVKIHIVSLAALALLKIIAWHDRHQRAPRKDAADLNLIFRNYLALPDNKERFWNDFSEWAESEDFDYEDSGARMLGHDIRRLIGAPGLAKLDEILKAQIEQSDVAKLPREMDGHSPERAHALLKSLYRGLVP
ncbi:hypothetical protein GCM10011487_07760 [Steroidobacter agaridevorans]|uniref:Nucleotidyltransferase n=2 Tax=Steroidobacter agaridevorans TaxID=2695856 RepID=A0A829Y7K2_9GAMM|nr:hypothetical protein GCM10011487_07760 [Steroidobacter agaridevorans]